MKSLLLVFGITFFSASASGFMDGGSIVVLSQTQEPNYEVALRFIDDYVKHIDAVRSSEKTLQWLEARGDLSNEFKSRYKEIIRKAKELEPEHGLGFDLILDAQDYPEKFEIVRRDGSFLVVRGVDWPEFTVTMKLKLVGSQWLVEGSGIVNIPEEKRGK
jgi:hypothetical protein